MKVLYVKCNSERSKEFQLKTVIYEDNGKRFTKKQALCREAIPHLKRMKESYTNLTASIVNPKIKVAKIIRETEDSLTFEFIEGISLTKRFKKALKLFNNEESKVISEYIELLKSGFKTTVFDSLTMVTSEFIKFFGDYDYSELNGELCFKGVSNIDIIFSNVIFTDNNIYLIDYEWILPLNIPISYISFRELHQENEFFKKMENHFITKVVAAQNSFYEVQGHYLKNRLNIAQQIQGISQAMVERDEQIVNLNQMVTDRDREVVSLGQAMVERDEQIISLNQAANENRLIVRQILSSNSWRVTSPLRKVKSFFRRK
jgi:O-antigen biosynthesis protein